MSAGINLGDAAIAIVHGRSGQGSIADLTMAIDHLDGTKAELKEALAYAAAQVYAYRHATNEDAALALGQIRTALSAFESRQASIHIETPGGTE